MSWEIEARDPNLWEALLSVRGNSDSRLALLSAEGRESAFSQLADYVRSAAVDLCKWGILKNHRIALVTDNGPHAVTAFLSVFSTCTCFPQNPSSQLDECIRYMEESGVSGVLHQADLETNFMEAACHLQIPVIYFSPKDEFPGLLSISDPPFMKGQGEEKPSGDDIAIILQTSGTTSRPKIVPFSHKRLIGTALSFGESLGLTEQDRTVNVTPLFHGYGLNTVVLATLFSGGSVICCREFPFEKFREILEKMVPTWFSAVPTVLQSIAEDASGREIKHKLRFIRSGSSALASSVADQLEKSFRVPVVEAYATTETVLIASNPVDMKKRKRGSAGIPAGCEVAIMDHSGSFVSSPGTGEILVKGPLVMSGYENSPEDNEKVFIHGWYRTGDEGFLDEEGFLYITGRIKEMINRGGEKVSPGEIDEVLLSHSSVVQAVAFPFPHATLGEDIAAAVVLRDGYTLTGSQLRTFVASKLAPFKVPSRIVILPEIPEGPTGKFVRRSLGELIHFTEPDNRPIETDNEKLLAAIWKETLGVDPLGAEDDFFASGGNSLLAALLVVNIQTKTGVDIPLAHIYMARTLAMIAKELDKPPSPEMNGNMTLIKHGDPSSTLYCVFSEEDEVSVNFGGIASTLQEHVRVAGIEKPDPEYFQTIEEEALYVAEEILQDRQEGPFHITGFCYGGMIAFKVAQILEERGHKVYCCLIDIPFYKSRLRYYLEYGTYFCLARFKWLYSHGNQKLKERLRKNARKFHIKTFWSDQGYFRGHCIQIAGKFVLSSDLYNGYSEYFMQHFDHIDNVSVDKDHLQMLKGPASVEIGKAISQWFCQEKVSTCRSGNLMESPDESTENDMVLEKTISVHGG